MKHMAREIFSERMDEQLKQNEGYAGSRERYRTLLQWLKEKLCNAQDEKMLLELDESVGEYSCEYGEAAYVLGFHDGLDMGLEHLAYKNGNQLCSAAPLTMEDMTDLIYIYDAYKALNVFLLGNETVLTFQEGVIGEMGRIYRVLGHYVPASGIDGELSEAQKILADVSLEPRERAKKIFAGL